MNKAATNHTMKPAAHNAAHLQKGVLSGIRVLDFTWKTVGPWAPRLLTHYGAEVIHVERAGGWDDHRFAAHRSLTTDAPTRTSTRCITASSRLASTRATPKASKSSNA
jgi:crotonobetainyl-CoA:carnitine CoA-transferase CaiB-like acyl-CoA transferase